MTSIESFRRNIVQLLESEEHMRLMYNKTKPGFDLWKYGHITIEYIPPGNGRIPQLHISSDGDTYRDCAGGDRTCFIIYPEMKTIELSHKTYNRYGETEDDEISITIQLDNCTEESFFQLSLIEDLRDIEFTDVLLAMRLFNYIQERIENRNTP